MINTRSLNKGHHSKAAFILGIKAKQQSSSRCWVIVTKKVLLPNDRRKIK
jgi:hypothetical protein